MRALSFLSMASAFSILLGQAQAVTSFGRSYNFSFLSGSLIRNWSFENLGDTWYDESQVNARFLAKRDNISAVSGSYVAKFSVTSTSGGMYNKLYCDPFRIEPSTSYTLSFYVKTVSNSSGIHPVVWFYSDKSATGGAYLGPAIGAGYPIDSDWTLYSYTFTSHSQASWARLALIELTPPQVGTIYFDDVLLEKGVISVTPRDFVNESVTYFNDFGHMVQNQSKVAGGGNDPAGRKYMVQPSSFDEMGRNTHTYVPYAKNGNPEYDPAFSTSSAQYNNGSNGKGSLGDKPYAKTDFTEVLVSPVSATFMPGVAWASKGIKSGGYYTNSLTAPSDPEDDGYNDAEMPYLFSWEKNVQDKYALSWKNSMGQVIQTAIKPSSTWLYTRYEYFANGNLKKILQHTDVPGDENQQEFREVTNFNSSGEVTSTYSKDRGLKKFWYNRLGQARFTRHESQTSNEYDFIDYDNMDRPVSMGTQIISGFLSTMPDQRSTPSGTKTEHKGLIYDNLDQFQARTGLLLNDVLPGKNLAVNGQGRVVCAYNLNKEVNLPGYAARDKFVATFYNYNKIGQVTEAYRFIGPVKDVNRRVHRVSYSYDSNKRLWLSIMEDNSIPTNVVGQNRYTYDQLGRIKKITGIGARFQSSYEYFDWGGLKSVTLGGAGNTSTGTRIDYAYHAQGWVNEIKAIRQSTGEIVFQQNLGYEGQAVGHYNVPTVQGKFDGSISQQLYKFANDVQSLNPIRVVNYQYDDVGRMTVADAQKNSGTPPWDALYQVNFANLSWTNTEDLDSRLTYDDNGRIATHRNGVSAAEQATYHYQPNSYKLDRVSGKLAASSFRDASGEGTFVYDSRGRMVEDKSKQMVIRYGWDGMPTEFATVLDDSLISDFNFYDEVGKRVSRVRMRRDTTQLVPIFLDGITFFVKAIKEVADQNPKVLSSITEFIFNGEGERRWSEAYGSSGEITSSEGRSGILGIGSQIGEITPSGTYRYFVKNHLGSTMRSVGENGEFLDSDGNVIDYLAYGSQAKLKTGTTGQIQTFTGKEQEETTGLYAFGARWFDPELGLWMSPDPAQQFSNPYYYGPSPVTGVDGTGLWFNPFDGDDWSDLGDDLSDVGDDMTDLADDFHTWAGGYGRGREDNLWRQGYRAMTGGDGGRDCNKGYAGGCWDAPPEETGGWGVGVTVSNGGEYTEGGIHATNANGQPILPIFNFNTGGSKAEREENEQSRNRRSNALANYRSSTESRPGDDVYACGPCVLLPLLPYISMVTPIILINGQHILRYGMYVAPYLPALQSMGQGPASAILQISGRNINKFFSKHGSDFGLVGNWSAARAGEVRGAINSFINSPGVVRIPGSYRGVQVNHYINPSTGQNIMADFSGTFVSGWKLGAEQLQSVMSTGRLY